MATLQRLRSVPVKQLLTRSFSLAPRTSAMNVMIDPAPNERAPAPAEMASLQDKEKGPWTELSKEEKVQLYKAQFPVTLADNLKSEDGTKVVGGILIGIAVAVSFFAFLKTYIGPEPPLTINAEWRAKNQEKRKLLRQDPISRS